jgi:hypothetical protein
LAVAGGSSVRAWALANETNPKTASRWTKEPGFQELVERHRRKVVDRTIGRLTRAALLAVTAIEKLAKAGTSEQVRLMAAKCLLEKLVDLAVHERQVKEFEQLKDRLEQLEREHAYAEQSGV